MTARDALLAAGLEAFDAQGFDQASVASIRAAAGVSNGSFFHFFGSKDGLAAALFLGALRDYHAAMVRPLAGGPDGREGIAALLHAHLGWVTGSRPQAKFLFEQARAQWLALVREEQAVLNTALVRTVEGWTTPLMAAGDLHPMPTDMFIAQIIGPAQVHCRAWLSGRSPHSPLDQAPLLIDCATRALTKHKTEKPA